MNREQIIDFLNTNQIDSSLAVEMIVDFAKNKGKNTDQLSILVKLITSQPLLMREALNNSIPYFKEKFNIITIYKDGFPISNI